jgi:hypothetical protein
MPEKTKHKEEVQKKEKETEGISIETDESEEDAWSRDQREKNYYYDDAHGYEIYNPDEDEEEE